MRKESTMMRVPREFSEVVDSWCNQAARHGRPMNRTDVVRDLTKRLKGYEFYPGQGFQEPPPIKRFLERFRL